MNDVNDLLKEGEDKSSETRLMTRAFFMSVFDHAVKNREQIIKIVRQDMLDHASLIPTGQISDDLIIRSHTAAVFEDVQNGIDALTATLMIPGITFERVHNLLKAGNEVIKDKTRNKSPL